MAYLVLTCLYQQYHKKCTFDWALIQQRIWAYRSHKTIGNNDHQEDRPIQTTYDQKVKTNTRIKTKKISFYVEPVQDPHRSIFLNHENEKQEHERYDQTNSIATRCIIHQEDVDMDEEDAAEAKVLEEVIVEGSIEPIAPTVTTRK